MPFIMPGLKENNYFSSLEDGLSSTRKRSIASQKKLREPKKLFNGSAWCKAVAGNYRECSLRYRVGVPILTMGLQVSLLFLYLEIHYF